MRKGIFWGLMATIVLFITTQTAYSFFIDFESGTDGSPIDDITGISFRDFNGFDSLYGDSRTEDYNTTSDDLGYSQNSGWFHHNGNFWLWAGPNADARGVIVDFDNNDGTFFSTGYSSSSVFYLDAYMTDGTMVSVSDAGNTESPMDYLTVNATAGLFLDYVVMHDTGNRWLVDDVSGDATGVAPVPEPATILLLGIGLAGIGVSGRKGLFRHMKK